MLLEHKATRNQVSDNPVVTKTANLAQTEKNNRCYECQDYEHFDKDCKLQGTGLIKCYKSNLSNHKAFECPNVQGSKDNQNGVKKYISNSNVRRRGTYQRRGFKRRKENSRYTYDSKRGRYDTGEEEGILEVEDEKEEVRTTTLEPSRVKTNRTTVTGKIKIKTKVITNKLTVLLHILSKIIETVVKNIKIQFLRNL